MKLASIERILSVSPIPNAEKIEYVKVLGYDCITQKGQFQPNDLCVFIQPDTVLPAEKTWTEVYRKKSNRVKAIRLMKQFWSFGIVESLSILPENTQVEEGQEVSELIGVIKYEPPIPQNLEAKHAYLPYQLPKTDEERFQNLVLPFGQIVDITLKVDGSSCTYYFKDGETGICSRSLEIKPESENNYTLPEKKYNVLQKLTKYCQEHGVNLALRGEVYGQGIQSFGCNPHARLPKDVAFFSVYLIDEHRYAGKDDEHYYVNVCKTLELPVVPMVEENVELTESLVKKYSDELEQLNGNLFEGVVIKGKDFSFKVINKFYDSKK